MTLLCYVLCGSAVPHPILSWGCTRLILVHAGTMTFITLRSLLRCGLYAVAHGMPGSRSAQHDVDSRITVVKVYS